MQMNFRKVAVLNPCPSRTTQSVDLKTRIVRVLNEALDYFKTSPFAKDCEAQVKYLVAKLFIINDEMPEGSLLIPAYRIKMYRVPVQVQQRLFLFDDEIKNHIGSRIEEKFGLGKMHQESECIEITLWDQSKPHSVLYIYQKTGDVVAAYFCDPSINLISDNSRDFFGKYDALGIAFKSLYRMRKKDSAAEINEKIPKPSSKERSLSPEISEFPESKIVGIGVSLLGIEVQISRKNGGPLTTHANLNPW